MVARVLAVVEVVQRVCSLSADSFGGFMVVFMWFLGGYCGFPGLGFSQY